jgi:homoserine dehydrogenase
MTNSRIVPIIFLGVGNIGGTLLKQVLECGEEVTRRTGLQLTPIALADISGVLFDLDGLPEEALQAARKTTSGGLLESVAGIRPLDEVSQALQHGAIVADMTATPTLRTTLDAGCGVVLANKIPLAGLIRLPISILKTHTRVVA